MFFVMVLIAILVVIYIRALISKDHRPPVVGPVLNQLIHFKRLFDYQTSLARNYSTYRLITPSRSEVYTVDPVNVEYMLKTNFPNYGKGEYHCGIMRDLFGDGIFAVDGEKWRHQRKLASYEFSTKVLRDFSTAVFRTNAAKLASRVSVAAVAKQMMDLQDLLMKSTLDSIFKVGFGVELNTLSGSDEFSNQFMKTFDDSNVIVYWRYVDLLWRIKRFLHIGLEATLKQNIKVIDNFIYELIRCKREQMENGKHDRGKEDILSRLLMESEKDPENMTDQYLRDITLSFIIAGKDTSANTLTWFFYMLCKHPLVQEKVVLEVREATEAEDNLSTDEFANKLTEAAVDKMQYLHAALTETLRLYPAVPVDGKSSEEDDILPDGFKIKKGDGMNYMAYAMGRMKYIWGEDAEEFLPERWLDNGVFRSESPFKFTAFQGWYHYSRLTDLLGDGIFTVDGEKWRHQRKIASYEFSTKMLRDFSSVVLRSIAAKLAQIMSEAASSNQTIEIQDLFSKSSLDSVFKVILGVELDSMCGTNEEGSQFCNAFDEASAITLYRYVDIFWKIKKILNIGSEAKLRDDIKLIDKFIYKVIRSKTDQVRKSKNDSSMKKEDILSRFLELNETNPKYLKDIILSFIIAGKDTTSSTLSWFFYMMCKHPLIQEKIAQEVRKATKLEEYSSFNELANGITEEALNKMQYLHAALTETLRLYPAVPVDSKFCYSDDTLPDGFCVRKGDMLGYQPYAMGRMKSIWGDDAEEFRPERWLSEDGVFQQESPFKFTAFQAGPRICLGKEFAYRQMKIFSAVLIGSHTFKLSDEQKAVNYKTMLTLHIAGGLHLRASHRLGPKSPIDT